VKQVMINRIALCEKCRQAFIINEQGDETVCDSCLDIEKDNIHDLDDMKDIINMD
jgi:hypothetical protein